MLDGLPGAVRFLLADLRTQGIKAKAGLLISTGAGLETLFLVRVSGRALSCDLSAFRRRVAEPFAQMRRA